MGKKKQQGTINVTVNLANSRVENFEGRSHTVYPVVFLVEGVHNGSAGPLYYSYKEILNNFEAWNGTPITVQHPADNEGNFCLLHDPAVFQNYVTGLLWNVGVKEANNVKGLKGEIWIDNVKSNRFSGLNTAFDEENMEVSTGLTFTPQGEGGTWNGEDFIAAVTNIMPDHLALLPGSVGACSWTDGCGVRNQEGGDMKKKKKKENIQEDIANAAIDDEVEERKKSIQEVIDSFEEDIGVSDALLQILGNEASHQQIRNQLQILIDKLDTSDTWHYVLEVYNAYFIYSAEPTASNSDPDAKVLLYKQAYMVDSQEEVTLSGDPVLVRRVVTYEAVNQTQTGGNKMACCEEKIQLLIEDDRSPFSEEDRESLSSANEKMIDVYMESYLKEEESTEEGSQEEPAANEEGEEGLEDKVANWLESAPQEVQDTLNSAVAVHNQQKTELISKITSQKTNSFSEQELKAMNLEQLKKVASLIPDPVSNEDKTKGAVQAILGMGNLTRTVTAENSEDVDSLDLPPTLQVVAKNKQEKKTA